MLLMQIFEATDAASEVASEAARLGPEMFILALMLGLGTLIWWVNFKYVVLPDRSTERETKQTMSNCIEKLTNVSASTHLLVQEMHSEVRMAKKLIPILASALAKIQKKYPDLDLTDELALFKGLSQ